MSIAGYVRTLKAFGNWLQAEELAEANAFRSLRKPRVPVKLIEPVPDDTLRRLLGLASVRDRAILLLLLDTGLRVSEAAGIQLGDLRPGRLGQGHGQGRRRTDRADRLDRARGDRPLPRPAWPGSRMGRCSSAGAAPSTGGACSRSSSGSRHGPGSQAGAALIHCATRSPGAISSTVATSSASSGSSVIRRSTWSSGMSRWWTRTSRRDIGWRRRPTGCWVEGAVGACMRPVNWPTHAATDVEPVLPPRI